MAALERYSVADAFARHAARDFGASGLRELLLEVFNDDQRVLTYRLVHAWRVDDGVCRSLYAIAEPALVAGTALLLVERPFTPEMALHLKFKTADRPVLVEPFRHRDAVLGTDFTYEDLRFWLPTDAFNSAHLDEASADASIVALTASRTIANSEVELRLALHTPGWLPVSIEWRSSGAQAAVRTYSATGLICVEGIWTPRRISIAKPRERYRSVMTLCDVTMHAPVDARTFDVDEIASGGASLLDGWARRTSMRRP